MPKRVMAFGFCTYTIVYSTFSREPAPSAVSLRYRHLSADFKQACIPLIAAGLSRLRLRSICELCGIRTESNSQPTLQGILVDP